MRSQTLTTTYKICLLTIEKAKGKKNRDDDEGSCEVHKAKRLTLMDKI